MMAMATRGFLPEEEDDFLAEVFAIVSVPEVVLGLHIHPQFG
jgi:hypothetical protein